ncbi:hypothetical protein GN956_G25898 [Arapaima gigas]
MRSPRPHGVRAIEPELPKATDIIIDSTTSALVTVFQATRNAGQSNLTFVVDDTLRNLTPYITGSALTFTLYSPSAHVSHQ